MPLQKITTQSKFTLEQRYMEVTKEGNFGKERGTAMLSFIKMVNETFLETTIWAMTSHDRLVLLPEDKWDSNCCVTISVLSDRHFDFSYPVPEYSSPWPNAVMTGMTNSLVKTKIYLLIAMKKSEGWQECEELQKLLQLHNL